jgi:hypothetical protein
MNVDPWVEPTDGQPMKLRIFRLLIANVVPQIFAEIAKMTRIEARKTEYIR